MLLLKNHVLALKALERGEQIEKKVRKQLELMGLIEGSAITPAGKLALEAIKSAEEILGEASSRDVERRVGSAEIQMIYASRIANKVIEPRRKDLESKGLAKDGELTEAALKIYHAYEQAIPRIEIYAGDVGYILSLPTGPAERGEFVKARDTKGVPPGLVYALEAMKMFAISPPPISKGSTVVGFTAIGRLIRLALREMFISSEVVLDDEIMRSAYALSRGRRIPTVLAAKLENLGLFYKGELTRAGRRIARAYELLRYQKRRENPPIGVSKEEMITLIAIDEIRKKYETNPEVYPNDERILKRLNENGHNITAEELSYILYTLEAMDFIVSEEHPRKPGELVYYFTEHGYKILEDARRNGPRDIRAYAVKAVMYAFSKRSPIYHRYKAAVDAKLISKMAVTNVGLEYMKLTGRIHRKPLVTRREAEIIRAIPSKGAFINEIEGFEGREERLKIALDKLESKGFVDILPNDYVTLTDLGRLAQIALLEVPIAELAFPINPIVVRVLQAALEAEDGIEDIATIMKLTRLPEETIKKAIIVIKRAGYRGKTGITDKGKALLQMLEAIEERIRKSEALSKEQESVE